MKILLITQLISLVILVPIPGYPDTPSNHDTTTVKNENTDKPISPPRTSLASGTSFSDIAQRYYGASTNDSSRNIFLEYPEPKMGWENEELCQNSATPSPINIPYESDLNIIKDGNNVVILSIDYNYLQSGKIEFQQNHRWGIGILNGGSIRVRIEKKEYIFYLSEIYFHLFSEHRLENKQYPLEMQLVHYRDNYQENNEKLIISVLFDYSNNIENGLLNDLKVGLSEVINNVDFAEIIKDSKSFYYYKGGLTIPPCSENVHWIIFKDINNMAYSQFETIKNWIENTQFYKTGYGNARGIKPLYNRKIYYESKFNLANKVSFDRNTVEENKTDSGKTLVFKFINLSNLLMFISLLFL